MNAAVSRTAVIAVALGAVVVATAAFAAEAGPANPSAPAQSAPTIPLVEAAPVADSHTTGAIAAAIPAGQPAAAAPRRPRSYAECKRIAQQRRYRGAERRHYVQRCQLGYGRALFRRRN